ncbi:hypothetical protein ColLi_08522 [Colletotrichum liriopes]|uniref:Uncharacterized protein n=1 Tax=Colletotrichum liriopes TaxID=708192 RepID=A0AA37GRV8_9PEZI|nr:hypothetical protein ColLi_08522 [Colletotrichum liriopes]
MTPNSWTDNAEKDLIWAFIKASNGGKIPKADWNLIHEMMTAMGYNFTINALNQRWSKTIVKNYGQRTNGVGNVASSTSASGSANTLASPAASRKRAAPGARGRRGNQAAHEMAAGAAAADDGQDDDEPELEDIKPKAKRTKTSKNDAVAGLNNQSIDLTDDGENPQPTQRLLDMQIRDEIKVEGENGYFGHHRDRRYVISHLTASPLLSPQSSVFIPSPRDGFAISAEPDM